MKLRFRIFKKIKNKRSVKKDVSKDKSTSNSLFARIKRSWQNDFGFKKRFLLISIVGIMIVSLTWLLWGMPLPSQLGTNDLAVSTKIFDRKGKLIYEIFGNQRRTPIKLDEIPEHIKQATIAIEDKDFYKHSGFSITGIGRSVKKILFEGRVQGGSTITQQLVKNALLTSDRTIKRKGQELILAIIIESTYSKDEILELYLNQIPYGGTAYGIEAASEAYFGKPAKDLTLAEASALAGLPAAPSRYSPFKGPELTKERQNTVLSRMVEDGYITEEEKEKAKEEELKFEDPDDFKAPHFALWIKEQLSEKYGERVVEQGGLRVTTTLDLDLQESAEKIVADEIEKLKKSKVGNGAALATLPATGEVLAMIGSYDYFAEDEDGKVNILFAKRQPGSSIKPLNYALAIKDKKITAATPMADVPTCFSSAGQALYCPVNYDGTFHGPQQIRYSLGNSLNIPAVRVLALNGTEHFIDFARDLGITTFEDPKNYGLSLTLGGGEVMPYDMAVAFGVFANGGIKQPLVSILKVENWKGEVLEEVKMDKLALSGQRVIEPDVPFIISDILLDNGARSGAFGSSSFLNVNGHPEVSVKTGTTNDRRDNWTIGYTKDVLVVTWVGNNDNSPMSGAVSGVSGASPIWNRIIKEALDKAEDGEYNDDIDGHGRLKQPENVVRAEVCSITGNTLEAPLEGTPPCSPRSEYFLKDAVGARLQAGRTSVQIDKTTGILANPKPVDKGGTPPENIESHDKPYLLDPLGTLLCLDCPVQNWPATIGYPFKSATQQ